MDDTDKTREHRQNEEYALSLLKYAPNPVLVYNMDSSVRYVNLAFEELTGFSASEVIGQKRPYPWWQEEKVAEYLRTDRLKDFPVKLDERQHRKKNGELFWIARNSAPITNNGKTEFLLVNWVDITERKTREVEYRTIVSTAIDGFWLADMQGHFLDVNNAYGHMTRYSRDELLNMSIPDIEAVEKPEETAKRIQRIKEVGYDHFETRHRRKDGEIINVEVSVNYLPIDNGRMFVFIRDITERKKAEEALRASEKKYADLVEKSNDGILVIQDGLVKFANSNLEYITGYIISEEIGKPFSDIIAPEFRELVIDRYKKRLGGNRVPGVYEAAILSKEGKKTPVEINASIIEYENRPATMAIVRDITERKKAEDELRWKTAFLDALVHSSNDGIIVVDQKGNRILQNQRTSELWKIPPEISERRDDSQVQHVKNMTRNPDQFYEKVHFLQTHPSKTSHDEVELVDGRFLERYSSPVTGKDGTYYGRIWTFHDITARKQAEEALRLSEESFRNSLDTLPLGILILGKNESGAVYMNRALLDIAGCESIEEFRKIPMRQRLTPESYAEWEERLAGERSGEYIAPEVEMSIIRKDGEIRRLMAFRKEVLWNGKRQYQILYRDITEQRRAEEALRESEVNFRNSLDSLPLGVLIRGKNESGAVYMNRALLDIAGYENIEEFRKIPIKQRFTPKSYAEWEERLAGERRGEDIPPETEVHIIRKDGEIRHLTTLRKDVLWNGKRQYEFLYHDITEQRRAEELNQKVQEYEELDRLKTAILSTVSHELRTPLATIKGYATMLLRYDKRLEAEEKFTYLQSIDSATERLTDLVNHLLDMSRLDAGLLRMEKCPTRVSDLLKKAVAEARLTRNHNIELVTSKRLPSISLDPRRIRQVIDNLIDNACKYSPEGTEVLLIARRKGKEVVISVTDHGVGIPDGEIGKVFNRMHRLEQRLAKDPGGLGLGLSLCKGLVEAHGGRIWVTSRESKGSTFYFSLPVTSKIEK